MLSERVAIAPGWSPVGRYASDVLKGGTGETSVAMATTTSAPPYHAYAAIMATFAGGLAAAGALGRLSGRDAQEHTALDFAVLAAASFKASRTIARDEVTSFIREPFTEEQAHEGGEEPVHTGDLQQAIGELITCSRCV